MAPGPAPAVDQILSINLKGKTMKLSHFTLFALLGASLGVPSFAQPGPGMGGGPGGMSSMGPGGGQGQGQGMRFAFDQDNTRGWSLMTTEERTAYHDKMLAAKTLDECKAIQVEHHQAMEARAKEKGTTLMAPRQNACDRMQARGFFK